MHRPDGNELVGKVRSSTIPQGDELGRRLDELYDAAGDDRRPGGGRDAYFVVRDASHPTVEQVRQWGRQWLDGLLAFAQSVGHDDVIAALGADPTIRILEGIAPKNPKLDSDRTHLHRALIKSIPETTAAMFDQAVDPLVRNAYYFIGCDAMLRDYLLWPTLGRDDDPMVPYFRLWSHRVKFRSYQENQLDLYLVRRDD